MGHPDLRQLSRLPRLNENQLAVMAELASVGGRLAVRDLARAAGEGEGAGELRWHLLVKRGLVRIEEEPESVCAGWCGGGRQEACA